MDELLHCLSDSDRPAGKEIQLGQEILGSFTSVPSAIVKQSWASCNSQGNLACCLTSRDKAKQGKRGESGTEM